MNVNRLDDTSRGIIEWNRWDLSTECATWTALRNVFVFNFSFGFEFVFCFISMQAILMRSNGEQLPHQENEIGKPAATDRFAYYRYK